jgi:hypothetical protein
MRLESLYLGAIERQGEAGFFISCLEVRLNTHVKHFCYIFSFHSGSLQKRLRAEIQIKTKQCLSSTASNSPANHAFAATEPQDVYTQIGYSSKSESRGGPWRAVVMISVLVNAGRWLRCFRLEMVSAAHFSPYFIFFFSC